MRIRAYAGTVGILLLLAALLGGTGIIPTKSPTEIFHAGVGAIFVYLGFLQRHEEIVRTLVGGMGILLVVVKAVLFPLPLLWGESPLHGPIEITCLVVGVLSVFASRYLREEDGTPGG
ncbi:MAG: hypothetical protein M3283_03865 [Actinomycetota bacterium]|nr:hypothetical protein [Actinomycetota bacterium]